MRRSETREAVKASLNESEARFRDFAELGSDLLLETDEALRIRSIVGDAQAVYGLCEECMVGRTLWQLANADPDGSEWQKLIDDARSRRAFRDFELKISGDGETERWISTNGRPYYDLDGCYSGYRLSSTNITDRKQAEARLSASARQQQSVAALSQLALQRVKRDQLYNVAIELVSRTLAVDLAGIMELSQDGGTLRLAAERGWPARPAEALAVPVDRCAPLLRGVRSDGPVHFLRQSFDLVPATPEAQGAGVAVPIGEEPVRLGALVVCCDDTRAFSEPDTDFLRAVAFVLAADDEQRRSEATLRLRERAMEAVGEGILITDATTPDNPLIYVNPAFERITGYARDEVIGRNARFLQGAETDERAVKTMRAAIQAKATYRGSMINYRKDGSPFPNGLTISPIIDHDGTASHFVGTLSDETERNELESQLKQAQKMESLGHLTGGIAHDFNNLLAVILANSEILRDESGDPTLKEIAELVMTTAEKGAKLTQHLLSFGRRQLLNPQNVDLCTIVHSLSEMLSRTMTDDVTLNTLGNAERLAFVDRALFESALLNLVLNAREAMPKGGVLTIATDAAQVDESLSPFLPPGQYVRVSVADTGRGMAKDVLDRAFDPFFTTKTVAGGAGMGLSTVYGFAKQSGGHVAVESEVGKGTTVHLYLPSSNEDAKSHDILSDIAEHAEKPERPAGSGERILVVEDEPKLREVVSRQLSSLGYDVLQAEAGATALDILRSDEDIDLLFTDLIMPGGMSGFDLVRQARGFLPQLRVLLTTGYAGETDAMIAKIKEPILKKPYKKQQLATALRNVLDRAA